LGKLLVIQCVELRLAGRNVLELVRASKKQAEIEPEVLTGHADASSMHSARRQRVIEYHWVIDLASTVARCAVLDR